MEPNLSHIAEPLRYLATPIKALHPDPVNARRHGARNVAAIRESLQKFGQRKPLVVQKEGMIVRAGNGTLEAAIELGWEYLAAVVVDEADTSATAYALADNRTAELAEWDEENLVAAFQRLETDAAASLEDWATGFDVEEIRERIDAWENVELVPVDVQPPPKLAWVLIGIPTVRYGEIAGDVERIAGLPDVQCETTANNG